LQDQDINGLCIARGVKNINHALFADDTLLLGPATLPQRLGNGFPADKRNFIFVLFSSLPEEPPNIFFHFLMMIAGARSPVNWNKGTLISTDLIKTDFPTIFSQE